MCLERTQKYLPSSCPLKALLKAVARLIASLFSSFTRDVILYLLSYCSHVLEEI